MKASILLLLTLIIYTSCNKNDDNNPSDGIKPEDKQKAEELKAFLMSNTFELRKYYSESPIDYIDTDQVVKSETNLWEYVSIWLKDDSYTFQSNNQTIVEQNSDKIDTENSETIARPYSVAADKNGVLFKFLNHQYQSLDYRLIDLNDSVFHVSATWNNKTVISEYKISP